jgi:hypothetical protein
MPKKEQSSPGPNRTELAIFGAENFDLVMGNLLLAAYEFPNRPDFFYEFIKREMKLTVENMDLFMRINSLEQSLHRACLNHGEVGKEHWSQYQKAKTEQNKYKDYYQVSSSSDDCEIEIQHNKTAVAAYASSVVEFRYSDIADRIQQDSAELWKRYVNAAREVYPDKSENEAVFAMTERVMRSALVNGSLRSIESTVECQLELVEEFTDGLLSS